MKFTIEGFSQEYAMTLKKEVEVGNKTVIKKIDCTDLVILRWFVDFYPNMEKSIIEGREYVWLKHNKLKEDLPLLDISKRSLIDRMQKLVDFGILDYKLTRRKGNDAGTFSFYCFGSNYVKLVQSNVTGDMQSNDTGAAHSNAAGVVQSNDIPYDNQTTNKDNSISHSSISHSSINYNVVVEYLNEKAGTKFKASSKETQKHINARAAEGFTVEDFKTVIDKKCAEWIGTEWAQYLRPATLFGTKFEAYLNAPARQRKTVGATGVEIKKPEIDDLEGIF